jgi:hypothetical protein
MMGMKYKISLFMTAVFTATLLFSVVQPVHASMEMMHEQKDGAVFQTDCEDSLPNNQATECLQHCLKKVAANTGASFVLEQNRYLEFFLAAHLDIAFDNFVEKNTFSRPPPLNKKNTQLDILLKTKKRE